jgi:putative ABC transport system ATP-binding protein
VDPNLFRYVWRHSRTEQIVILGVILVSLPFYFLSLDVPKRIVNDAIQGRAFQGGRDTATFLELSLPLPEFLGGPLQLFSGIELRQAGYLLALALLFLALTLVNGAFKYVINVRKGILGERMLRRMRHDIFRLLVSFRPEAGRNVKPAEAASLIKDEVEPIGGFIGDAFVQPAFLLTQALTALLFIMLQSFWLGLIALLMVLVQAFVVPALRKEQLRLGRERQKRSRQLAGRVGETVDAMPAIQTHAVQEYQQAEVSHRLGDLFAIRVALFRRKFAVKYLNNLLAQITPFFFYAIGGYAALTGHMDIGQLVAVIAAYRDLPPPVKELIDWDQQAADCKVKYEQIIAQFPAADLNPEPLRDLPPPSPTAPFALEGVRIVDGRGQVVLETTSLTLPRPRHVALVGPSGGGGEAVVRILARQHSLWQGQVKLGGEDIRRFPPSVYADIVGWAGPEPNLMSGSIRDNVAMALWRRPPDSARLEGLALREAELSGNALFGPGADWSDFAAAGVRDAAELDRAIVTAITLCGGGRAMERLGLDGRVGRLDDKAEREAVLAARSTLRGRLAAAGVGDLVEPFDPERYNTHATIAENLLFGAPQGALAAIDHLSDDPFIAMILEAESLVEPLIGIGLGLTERRIAERRYRRRQVADSEAEPEDDGLDERLRESDRMLKWLKMRGSRAQLAPHWRKRMLTIALAHSEAASPFAIDPAFEARVLRARRSVARHLPQGYAELLEFYDPDRVMGMASLRDNLLFGRLRAGEPEAEAKVGGIVREVARTPEINRIAERLSLRTEVGVGGRQIQPALRHAVNLARSVVRRPATFVIDGALRAMSDDEAVAVLAGLGEAFADRSLFVCLGTDPPHGRFDTVLTFDQTKLLSEAPGGRRAETGGDLYHIPTGAELKP